MNSRLIERLRVVLTIVGAMTVYAGERYFSSAKSHWWLTGSGLALMTLGLVFAGLCLKFAKDRGHTREYASWKICICWQAQILAAFGAYFLYLKVLGDRPTPDTLLTKSLLMLWVLLGTLGFFMGIGTEWAQRSNGRGEFAESQRVVLAAQSWLKIGILAVVVGLLNYAGVHRNVVWDVSYLKTTKASESTMKMLGGLSQDLEVAIFFPQGNEVLSQAKLFFNGLENKFEHVKFKTLDVEINPLAAETYKVSKNGVVVLKFGGQTERFELGLTIAGARKTLKNLDSEFQKAFLSVTEKRKNIYFTRGHGELSWTGNDEGSGLKSIKLLDGFLRSLNFSMRFFGVSEGAAKEVPVDADAVVIVGGDQPFLPEEASAIKTYVERGGRLFVLLDVDTPTETAINAGVRDASKDPLVKWLKDIGIEFDAKILANTDKFARATNTEADVWFVPTNVYTSHESVQTLAKNEQHGSLLTFKSGSFKTRQNVAGWNVTDTVRSLSDTFVDENRDFKFNEGKEKREPRVIGAVAEQKVEPAKDKSNPSTAKLGRIVAFADATIISDPIIRNQPNLIYFVDSLRWLVGDMKASGVATTEEDVRIRHTNKEDIAWFYGSVALVPSLVLLAGGFVMRRGRRKRLGGDV